MQVAVLSADKVVLNNNINKFLLDDYYLFDRFIANKTQHLVIIKGKFPQLLVFDIGGHLNFRAHLAVNLQHDNQFLLTGLIFVVLRPGLSFRGGFES